MHLSPIIVIHIYIHHIHPIDYNTRISSLIDEKDEAHSDLKTINDLDRLKKLRTSGKMVHTKSGKKLMQAVRIGDDRDEIRALRAVFVRDFDDLEKRHDRYVSVNTLNLTIDDLDGEKQWMQVYDHQKYWQTATTTCSTRNRNPQLPSSPEPRQDVAAYLLHK